MKRQSGNEMSVRVGVVRSLNEFAGEGDARPPSTKYEECAVCHSPLLDGTEKSVWECHNPACQRGAGTACHIRCMFDKIRSEYDGGPEAVCPNAMCNKRLNDFDREKIRFIFTAELKDDYERQVTESNTIMLANVQLTDTVGRLEAENGTLRRRVVLLENENATLRSRVSELEDENATLRSRVHELAKENEALRSRVKNLEQENAALKATVHELKNENAELKGRVHRIEVESAANKREYQRENHFLREGQAETNRVIAQMKSTIDRLVGPSAS